MSNKMTGLQKLKKVFVQVSRLHRFTYLTDVAVVVAIVT